MKVHESMEWVFSGGALFAFDLDPRAQDIPLLSREVAPPILCGPRPGYKPRYVRGDGAEREGYCERCSEWFRLKTSSYWYHMNYKHGISPSGRVFPEPVVRCGSRDTEAFCGECNAWIPLGASRKGVRYCWFRHWQKSHGRDKPV